MRRAVRAALLESSGSESDRADAGTVRAEDSVGGLSARTLNAVKAARDAFLNAGCIAWIGRRCKLFRQESQFVRTKAISFAFQRTQLRGFERNFLTRRLSHDH